MGPRFAKLACLIAAACAAGGCRAQPEGEAVAARKPGARPAPVEVARARAGSLGDSWTFLGEVRSLQRSELAAGAAGAVTRVSVREGDRVVGGQLLVEVDLALARARVAVAAATEAQIREELKQSEREAARFRKLGPRGVADLELERARSRVAVLAARLAAQKATTNEARALLARHRVTAPYAGVVAKRRVDPGDWVDAGTRVLDVVSLGQVEVIVNASPRLLGYIAKGDAAVVGRHKTKAKVVGVVPALDPAARTAAVRLLPQGEGQALLPGSAVEVHFAVERAGEGVIVPRDALLPGAIGTRVVRVVDGKASPLPVEVIVTSSDAALVVGKGLAVGDRVVTRGNERLRPGQAVHVAD